MKKLIKRCRKIQRSKQMAANKTANLIKKYGLIHAWVWNEHSDFNRCVTYMGLNGKPVYCELVSHNRNGYANLIESNRIRYIGVVLDKFLGSTDDYKLWRL